ncbi:MAG: DUF2799 domain-containing protein [Desulfamplus sp.]|nr:DUF2799 domain-containing protein [Desulfamplus sp.]
MDTKLSIRLNGYLMHSYLPLFFLRSCSLLGKMAIVGCLLIGILFLGGCATMTASECKNADWEMVGFEDGSKGRLSSYVENHRRACAQHNITPVLDAYLRGHSNGVKQFCTEYNGFEKGKEGFTYNNVCPPELSDEFLKGYYVGQKFYAVLSEIRQSESAIRSDQRAIQNLVDEVRDTEEQLVHRETTESDRRHLLKKIRRNQREIGRLEQRIFENQRDIDRNELEYDRLKMEYSY